MATKKDKKEKKGGFGFFKSVWDWFALGENTSFRTMQLIAEVEEDGLNLKREFKKVKKEHERLQKEIEKHMRDSQ